MSDVSTTPRRKLSTRERLAVFERCRGTCECGYRIRAGDRWQADHPRALGLGGKDDPNLLVVLCEACYVEKNPEDMRRIAKAKRVKAKHLGIKRPRRITRWRNFKGEIVVAPRER